MSKPNCEELVYGLKLSSVVPAKVSGEGKVHELKGIDIAMKLHYVKGVYFFSNDSGDTSPSEGNYSFISIHDLKNHDLFVWLETYFMTCGRVRTSGSRPVIKLNDAGVRIVEAQSSKSVDEWLAMDNFASLNDHLVYAHVLGPDLGFVPLVFIQVTWFRCGGVSVGLSWAHILGDVFSASSFMNMLGLYLQGHHKQPMILAPPKSLEPKYPLSNPSEDPLSVKRVDPVGDCWVAPTNCKMGVHSFYLTQNQLMHLRSSVSKDGKNLGQCFEIIAAIMWKSIAKIRRDLEPKVVTLCRPKSVSSELVTPHNGQVIGTVKAKCSVSTSDVPELASLIVDNMVDETNMVDEVVEKEMNSYDFIAYGANLTFVDMEDMDLYDFELRGLHPTFASYTIGGMGDEGVVHVLPGPSTSGSGTKLVISFLPQHEIEQVKLELKNNWGIA